MKGVILAGGNGTRLLPLTKVTNKHLLPIYNKPMIYYPIATLVEAGVTNILIVSGRGHAGHFLNLLGSGREFGATFSYEVQEEAGGIAQALGLAEDFADGGKIVAILGDNMFEDSIAPFVERFASQQRGGRIFLKEVPDAHRFGVAVLENGRVRRIEEKPKHPPSNLAVTGLYMYDSRVFSIIKMLTPSVRGELEITDVSNRYLADGELEYEILKGWWTDAGTSFDALLRANTLVASREKERAGRKV